MPQNIDKPKPYIAPVRLDTPPLPSSKKYRKTPPPAGFFGDKETRTRYKERVVPSLYTLTDESEEGEARVLEESSSGGYATSSSSSGRSYYTSSSSARGWNGGGQLVISTKGSRGGITIGAGIPAASIVTPVPINAVRTVAIRDLVSRVTELGGFKI